MSTPQAYTAEVVTIWDMVLLKAVPPVLPPIPALSPQEPGLCYDLGSSCPSVYEIEIAPPENARPLIGQAIVHT